MDTMIFFQNMFQEISWSKEEEGAYIFWMKQVPVVLSSQIGRIRSSI
jgi:hypothetical protein